MSKKIKKAFAASIGLMTPATFARENISAVMSDKIQHVETSSDRIISLCAENPNLSSLLTTELFNKKGEKTGRITLEPLCEKHRGAFTNTIFDIKEPIETNKEHNSYYQYFTSKNEITADKGKRYFEKHMRNMAVRQREQQNIFFTISYAPYNNDSKTYDVERYCGFVGISRAGLDIPNLEVIVARSYAGKGIASNALKCMIDFFNSYNFVCENDSVEKIEAVISTNNHGSIGMVKKNSFVNVGRINDPNESNGFEADRWIRRLNTNPIFEWARHNPGQKVILPNKEGHFRDDMAITFNEFLNHKRHFRNCKKDYDAIFKQITTSLNRIAPGQEKTLKESLSSWPAAWYSTETKQLDMAINLEQLPNHIQSVKDWNATCKHKKLYINYPNIKFKNIEVQKR